MKKILSFALVAAIGLGSMNVQANDAKSENVTKQKSKRAYIRPLVRLGLGTAMTLLGALSLFFSVYVLPKDATNFKSQSSSKLNTQENKYVTFLQSYSTNSSLFFGIAMLAEGIPAIQTGLTRLKEVKKKRELYQVALNKLASEYVEKAKKLEQ